MNSSPIKNDQYEVLFQNLIESEKYAHIGRLTSGIAHNIQSPLTAIKGYTQLIQADYGNIEELNLILKEVQHLQSITHNLMSKMRYLQDETVRPILMNDLIHMELQFFNAHLYFKHKIKKQVILDPELPVLHGVHTDFICILMNLISNSINAMADINPKEFLIETRHDDKDIMIIVRDTGTGIPKDKLDYILEPPLLRKYKTDELSKTNGYPHVGIGLFIVKNIVDKYRGILNIQSNDSGTEVVVKVPYKNE